MTKDAIIAILRRYTVCLHYKATSQASPAVRLYAVFSKTGQVTEQASEPMSHADAQKAREELIAADILALAGLGQGG